MDKEIKKTAPVKSKNFRELKGVIVSTKMQKTVVVEVNTSKAHKLYKKRYTTSKRYKAHDENNDYKVGEKVLIRQVRPLSKDKRWAVIKRIK
jgi:small subunit ribosomal protein S17